ncbi:MAG: RDD family protein [Candidatus Kapabacteria bacterium]|nr:RDD family protein [Candidatus Kapabacteria bacterium]
MKCEKCGNEYPTQYYFTTPTICNNCYQTLSENEKQIIQNLINADAYADPLDIRVGFWKRLAATLIDGVITAVIIVIVFYLTGKLNDYIFAYKSMFSDPIAAQEILGSFTLLLLLIGLGYSLTEVLFAASPGKMVLGIKIAEQDGKRASIGTLAFRFLIKHIELPFSFLFVFTQIKMFSTIGTVFSLGIFVGYFFVFAAARQGFHDMLAKTAVFNNDDIKDN